MPTSARKSSVGGARRGPQKAHIPYRGDNPEVGKKTGIAVQHVERKSDGFEPFEELLQQADGRTPPRPKGRKKSIAALEMDRRYDDYDDEDGEMSMQLDSPVQHLVNMRPPSTPSTAGRRRSSIRPVARTSDVDFDKIPSPKPSNSMLQRSSRNTGPGPSSLSQSTRARDFEPDFSSGNEDAGDYDDDAGGGGGDTTGYYDEEDTMDQTGFDDYGPQETPKQSDVRRTSTFSRIEEESEEEDEEEQDEEEPREETPPPPPKPKQDKGKQKAPPREPSEEQDEEMEDEIAQGLEDVTMGTYSDDEPEPDPVPPVKKVKMAPEPKAKKPAQQTESRSKKENKPEREGVRRSKREHFAPLEYWRGERVVYGKTAHSGPVLVPQIKEIIRIPKEAPAPLGHKRKRGSVRPRSRSRTRAIAADEDVIPPALPVPNPEEGWDDDTESIGRVLAFTSMEEVERRIAWTARMVHPVKSANQDWMFEKIFGDDDFIAAGQMVIPPNTRKPSKSAKDNTYIFYVIEGAVNFKIHETSRILSTGGMFMVPRGNTYLIENISNRDAKVFFTQARKVDMNHEEMRAKAAHVARVARRKSGVRSSSVAAPPTTGRPSLAPSHQGRAASMAANPTSRKA